MKQTIKQSIMKARPSVLKYTCILIFTVAPNIAKTTFWVDLTMPLDPVYNTTFLETFHKVILPVSFHVA